MHSQPLPEPESHDEPGTLLQSLVGVRVDGNHDCYSSVHLPSVRKRKYRLRGNLSSAISFVILIVFNSGSQGGYVIVAGRLRSQRTGIATSYLLISLSKGSWSDGA